METLFQAGLAHFPSALQLLGYSETLCVWRLKFHNMLFTVSATYFIRTIAIPMLLKIRGFFLYISASLYMISYYPDIFFRNVFIVYYELMLEKNVYAN